MANQASQPVRIYAGTYAGSGGGTPTLCARFESGGNAIYQALSVTGTVSAVGGYGTIQMLKPSNFGYSSGYGAAVIGATSGNVTVCLGVDPIANASGSFSGNGSEIMVRNVGSFISPNAANTGFNSIMSWGAGTVSFTNTVSANITGNSATATLAANSTLAGGFTPTTAGTASTICVRDGSNHLTIGGYYFGQYINTSDNVLGSGITNIVAKFSDNYHRSATAGAVATFISGQSMNISGSSTSCSGNAASATTATNHYGAGASYIASSTPGTSYSAAIQVREAALAGAQGGAMAYAPRLGFHWSAVVASSIAMEANGRIGIFNNPGTAYEAFVCGTLTASNFSGSHSGTSSGTNTGDQTNISGNAATATNAVGVSASTNGASLQANTSSTYSAFNMDGSRNGWSGYRDATSGFTRMYSGTNGGIYAESGGRWITYYSYANACMGFNTSTTTAGYDIYTPTGIYTAGYIVAGGNITAYSDERLKDDWKNLPDDFVANLASVKSGSYTRKDKKGLRQVGVSAQSLMKILPDAVVEDKDKNKTLSVSYGNAAMVSAVQLAKEVVKLNTIIKSLITRIKSLEDN